MELNKLEPAVIVSRSNMFIPIIRLDNVIIYEQDWGYESKQHAAQVAEVIIKAFKEGYMRGTYTIND